MLPAFFAGLLTFPVEGFWRLLVDALVLVFWDCFALFLED